MKERHLTLTVTIPADLFNEIERLRGREKRSNYDASLYEGGFFREDEAMKNWIMMKAKVNKAVHYE